MLDGKIFILAEYFSEFSGGAVVVSYDRAIVGAATTGGGPPTIVSFTREYACDAQRPL
jgi:hypothetical protein